jgi:hypothetical protein
LLAFRRNREPSAWWVFAALACGFGLQPLLRSTLSFIPSQPLDAFADAVNAVNFGLGAVWLVSGYLVWRHRFVTFLAILATLSCYGAATFILGVSWDGGMGETMISATIVLISAFILALALTLAGLACRHRYRPIRLSAWSLVFSVAGSLLVISPFLLIALINNPGRLMLAEFLESVGVLAGISFGVMLPYLVICFFNEFYRERVKGLLHLGREEAPPVIVAAPVAQEAVAK